jgi:glycine/sarcosine N-methyltransferase
LTEDPYKDLADRYDLMKAPNADRDAFFRRHFEEHDVKSVLDCACGTGCDLLLFHSLGCDTFGSDLSDSMLIQARERIAEANGAIPVTKADFRDLPSHFDRKFDAVVCLSNSINEVLDESQAVRALMSMRDVLRDGGLLIIDQGQTDASMKNPPIFAPIMNDRDFSRLFAMSYSGDWMEVNVIDFIHTENATDFRIWSVTLAIRLQDDWTRILEKAGFDKVDFYGCWKGKSYSKDASHRLILVARK